MSWHLATALVGGVHDIRTFSVRHACRIRRGMSSLSRTCGFAAVALALAAVACGGGSGASGDHARAAPAHAPVGRTTVTAAHVRAPARPPAPSLAAVEARIAKDDAQLLAFDAACQADDGPYSAAERSRLRKQAAEQERNAPPAAADTAGTANDDASDGGASTGASASATVAAGSAPAASQRPSEAAKADLLDRECAAAALAAASLREKDAGLSATPELRR